MSKQNNNVVDLSVHLPFIKTFLAETLESCCARVVFKIQRSDPHANVSYPIITERLLFEIEAAILSQLSADLERTLLGAHQFFIIMNGDDTGLPAWRAAHDVALTEALPSLIRTYMAGAALKGRSFKVHEEGIVDDALTIAGYYTSLVMDQRETPAKMLSALGFAKSQIIPAFSELGFNFSEEAEPENVSSSGKSVTLPASIFTRLRALEIADKPFVEALGVSKTVYGSRANGKSERDLVLKPEQVRNFHQLLTAMLGELSDILGVLKQRYEN